jgi:KDO2-lipid IV(A) lauroyltransferase
VRLYSNLNLLLIGLFTRLTPKFLHPPCAFLTGSLFYLFAAEQRRGVRSNIRVVTGRHNVERLVFSTFYKYSRNWVDVMMMMRLRGEHLNSLIGRRIGAEYLERAMAGGAGAILISPHLGNWELEAWVSRTWGTGSTYSPFASLTRRSTNCVKESGRKGIRFIYVDRNDTSRWRS